MPEEDFGGGRGWERLDDSALDGHEGSPHGLGLASSAPRQATAHDRVYDKKSGKAAVRTGLPRDTYKTAVQYDGNPFNPFSNESDDGLRAAVKFGFRSKALSLQVKLAERLQLATDPDKRFLTMQQAFEEVIRIDRNFSLILADIKEAYDEKVELVASKDSDAVSLAAYEALRNRERMAAERNEALQDEVHMLRELAAQGNVARKLVEDHDLAHLLVSPRSDASQDEACKAASAGPALFLLVSCLMLSRLVVDAPLRVVVRGASHMRSHVAQLTRSAARVTRKPRYLMVYVPPGLRPTRVGELSGWVACARAANCPRAGGGWISRRCRRRGRESTGLCSRFACGLTAFFL
jgi:hypothetical protein